MHDQVQLIASADRLMDPRPASSDGTVALAEGWLGQAGLMPHRPAAVPRPRSSFAGFRFPTEVIILALGTGTACPTATWKSYWPNAA